ncbi:hypothetical protein BS47DRAFT_1366235 [Hydnum rufescens UP504]|uniref:Uncharacterized protein n=1 Tax=Hydnum rufescens UP504 TaxID=1448309 RepID=A0A9P6ALL9_9AGAM|nr:hypothetical protein BS47DRAFT_1366235 [Hydnum rufescens UP504]
MYYNIQDLHKHEGKTYYKGKVRFKKNYYKHSKSDSDSSDSSAVDSSDDESEEEGSSSDSDSVKMRMEMPPKRGSAPHKSASTPALKTVSDQVDLWKDQGVWSFVGFVTKPEFMQ